MSDLDRMAAEHVTETLQGAHDGEPHSGDSWDMFADAMDLTIEGHRLIAQEIVYETKLLGRAVVAWMHGMAGAMAKRWSSPPV
jgi:hypothetical protein